MLVDFYCKYIVQESYARDKIKDVYALADD